MNASAPQELANTLHAESQGWTAAETVLLRLDHPGADPARLDAARERAARAGIRAAEAWSGRARPSASDAVTLTGLAERLRALAAGLDAAIADLRRHGHEAASVAPARRQAAQVLAALAWSAYAADHAARGEVARAMSDDDADAAARGEAARVPTGQLVHAVNELVTRLSAPGPPQCQDLLELHASAGHLPAALAARLAELTTLAERLAR